MRNHYDKSVLGNLFKQIHNLNAGFAVQGARRLVRKYNIRIIDERARDGYTLHLTAGKLIRSFSRLIFKPDLTQSLESSFTALLAVNAGKSKTHCDVFKYIHMRN